MSSSPSKKILLVEDEALIAIGGNPGGQFLMSPDIMFKAPSQEEATCDMKRAVGMPEATAGREAPEEAGGRGSSVVDSARCATSTMVLPLKTFSERRALEPKA